MSNLVFKVLFSLLGVCFIVYFATIETMLPVFDEPMPYEPPEKTSVYVISLSQPGRLLGEIKTYLKSDAKHVQAVNRSDTFQYRVPLYTLHTMEYGRHDHMQIGNREALGCLLSHVSVWRQFLNSTDDSILVFEEDAIIDAKSASVLASIWSDLQAHVGWSVVMLEKGHTMGVGWNKYNNTQFLLECKESCTWYGTRGYLLSREGARILLQHVEPYVVQVDSLILLVSVWDDQFTMLATNTDVAHADSKMRSTIRPPPCMKCMVPLFDMSDVLYCIGVALCGICVVCVVLYLICNRGYFLSQAKMDGVLHV